MWNLDGGVDPAVALAGSEDADEEHHANPAARVAARVRRREATIAPASGIGSESSSLHWDPAAGQAIPFAVTHRRQPPPATPMSPTDAARVVRFQRRPGTVSAEVRAIGGRGEGGKDAKIERE